MVHLKNDSFLSKAKGGYFLMRRTFVIYKDAGGGGTLGGWFKDIKTRDCVQNLTQKNIQLDCEWTRENLIIGCRPIVEPRLVRMVESLEIRVTAYIDRQSIR